MIKDFRIISILLIFITFPVFAEQILILATVGYIISPDASDAYFRKTFDLTAKDNKPIIILDDPSYKFKIACNKAEGISEVNYGGYYPIGETKEFMNNDILGKKEDLRTAKTHLI